MKFIGCKIRGAANVPSQLLHDTSYPRTGTFSVGTTVSTECRILSRAEEFLHFHRMLCNLVLVSDKGTNTAYFGLVQAAKEN